MCFSTWIANSQYAPRMEHLSTNIGVIFLESHGKSKRKPMMNPRDSKSSCRGTLGALDSYVALQLNASASVCLMVYISKTSFMVFINFIKQLMHVLAVHLVWICFPINEVSNGWWEGTRLIGRTHPQIWQSQLTSKAEKLATSKQTCLGSSSQLTNIVQSIYAYNNIYIYT